MVNGPRDHKYGNTNKHLPIVLCLDISPSMRGPYETRTKRWQLQNQAVEEFLKKITEVAKSRQTAEIAFIAYADKIIYETEFLPLMQMDACHEDFNPHVFSAPYKENGARQTQMFCIPEFEPVEDAGTYLHPVLTRAVQKLEDYVANIQSVKQDYYTPFLVLATDCEEEGLIDCLPENRQQMDADIRMLASKCDDKLNASEMIVPFIVGIGDSADSDCLKKFAKGFEAGYIVVHDENPYDLNEKYSFGNTFKAIAKAIAHSTTCKGGAKEMKSILRARIKDTMESKNSN